MPENQHERWTGYFDLLASAPDVGVCFGSPHPAGPNPLIPQGREVPGVDSVFFHAMPDGNAVYAKHPRSPGLIAAAFYEGVDEGGLFI